MQNKDTWTLGGHTFTSRFILGSGKYNLNLIRAAVEDAGDEWSGSDKDAPQNGSVPWKYDTDHSHDSECCQNGYGQVSCGRDDRPSG